MSKFLLGLAAGLFAVPSFAADYRPSHGAVNTMTASTVTTTLVNLSTARAKTASGLRLEDDNGNLGLMVEDGGNVGIGTTNPESALDVTGTGAFDNVVASGALYTNQLLYLDADNTPATSGIIRAAKGFSLVVRDKDDAANVTLVGHNMDTDQFYFGSDTGGTQIFLRDDGSNAARLDGADMTYYGAQSWTGAGESSGLDPDGTTAFNVGTSSLVVLQSGNVGIGTTNPASELSYGANSFDIWADTSDGSDSKRVVISGGGAYDVSRGAYFSLNGNEKTGQPGQIIFGAGDVAGGDIRFGTGTNTDVLNITRAGNVGIGTTNPTEQLTVGNGGDAALTATSLIHAVSASDVGITARDSDNDVEAVMISYGSSGQVQIGAITNHHLRLITNNQNRMTFESGGEIGIGDDSPDAQLEILSNVAPTSPIFAISSQTDTTGDILTIQGDGDVGIRNTGPSYMLQVGDGTGDATNPFAIGTSTLVVTAQGNVGVGTTNPSQTLDVEGGIGLYSRTKAELEAITPGSVGEVYYVSDGLNSVNAVISTGTAVCQFDSLGVGGTAWH